MNQEEHAYRLTRLWTLYLTVLGEETPKHVVLFCNFAILTSWSSLGLQVQGTKKCLAGISILQDSAKSHLTWKWSLWHRLTTRSPAFVASLLCAITWSYSNPHSTPLCPFLLQATATVRAPGPGARIQRWLPPWTGSDNHDILVRFCVLFSE